MDLKLLNEYEYKTICFFFRFLKEHSLYAYEKFKYEAFERYYKSYISSLTTDEGYSYGFNLWYSEEEKSELYKKYLSELSYENHKIGYKEFIARRIKYSCRPLWYMSLLGASTRNAWYYDKKGKLSINIDWKCLENLWYLTIMEDKTDLFDEDDKGCAKIILRERCLL